MSLANKYYYTFVKGFFYVKIKALITGGLSVLFMFLIFIGGLSLFSEKAGIMNESLFKNLALIFAAVSIMIASVIAARMEGKGWLYGMIIGIFWLAITTVIALVVNRILRYRI